MHAISFNFPSSFDHFEGGLGDFPRYKDSPYSSSSQEDIDVSHVVESPSLDLYTKFKHSHSAPAYTVGEGMRDSSRAVMSCNIR